jgi:hypothetical protein
MRHGLGYERFAVNDEYNGLWETNEPNGPGRYHWKDGSEYNGECKQPTDLSYNENVPMRTYQ